MRLLVVATVAALLGGCTADMWVQSVNPYGVETDEFGVTSLASAPTESGFVAINNPDPGAGATKARLMCTLGAQVSDVTKFAGDAADIRFQRANCTRYGVGILPLPEQ